MTDEPTEERVPILTDEDFGDERFGPKMLALNRRERKFVFAYASGLATSQGEAARMAGYSQGAAGNVTACRLLQRERITDAILECCRLNFPARLPAAMKVIDDILASPKHPDRAKVALSVMSRLGFSEAANVNLNVSGEVVVSHVDAAVEDLRRLIALGVSREKLIETFGHSGLPRYEKMLADKSKVIEHDPQETESST